MAMTAERKAERAAARKREKELSKLTSVANLVKVLNDASGEYLRFDNGEIVIEGKPESLNFYLERAGFRPVRVTSNLLNEAAGKFCIDINTPSYCDPGSESYHSM